MTHFPLHTFTPLHFHTLSPMTPTSYALRCLVQLIPLMIGLSLLTFVISRVLPGDPVGLGRGTPGDR